MSQCSQHLLGFRYSDWCRGFDLGGLDDVCIRLLVRSLLDRRRVFGDEVLQMISLMGPFHHKNEIINLEVGIINTQSKLRRIRS